MTSEKGKEKETGPERQLREGAGRPPTRVRWRWSPEKFRARLRACGLTPGEVERYLRRCDPPVLANVALYRVNVVPAVETAAALAEVLGCEVRDFMEQVDPLAGGDGEAE